ncbi:hypothetical protein PVK06_003752 [Gossypium arboreum]|uniref:Uncharacterized protein n=1 Tax=Gossypium arboreum TaxID=29729 RepID=A0ABR0QR15_GOSAR|nr:hypothetical protein PVK06_003752 [Gossypium arboreum]
MASLLLGAAPISAQSLNLSYVSRISSSHSQTLGTSLSVSNSSFSLSAASSPSIPYEYTSRLFASAKLEEEAYEKVEEKAPKDEAEIQVDSEICVFTLIANVDESKYYIAHDNHSVEKVIENT